MPARTETEAPMPIRTRLPVVQLALGLALGAVLLTFGGAQATPAPKPTASHVPVTYLGTFLKTLSRAPDVTSEWHPLQDKYSRFNMAVPADWVEGTTPADQEGMLYALVAYEVQSREGFNANLIVSQTQAADGFVMKPSMVAAIADKMIADMKPYKFVVKDKAFAWIDGVPCVIIGGSMEIDGRKLRNLQLRMVYRGLNYLFTFTVLESQYAQCEPVFARQVKSLVFERETPSPSSSPSDAPSSAPR